VHAARAELAYDPQVLAAVSTAPTDAGRVTLAFEGPAKPPAEVRFRVIARLPTTTRIELASARATDARGASVAIGTPGAHEVAIVVAKVAN
jgi:hypothetical protein